VAGDPQLYYHYHKTLLLRQLLCVYEVIRIYEAHEADKCLLFDDLDELGELNVTHRGYPTQGR
jgi:hypothetical protein